VASKHAIRAFGLCLRQELALEGLADDIEVVTVLPPSVDTPLFQHAANYTGRRVRPMPPVHAPEEVAAAVLDAVELPRAEVLIGAARVMTLPFAIAPGLVERPVAGQVERKHLDADVRVEPTPGNVLEPMTGTATVTGGWRDGDGHAGLPAKRWLEIGGAVAAAALASRWLASRHRPSRA
jgi:hypothetical protein